MLSLSKYSLFLRSFLTILPAAQIEEEEEEKKTTGLAPEVRLGHQTARV